MNGEDLEGICLRLLCCAILTYAWRWCRKPGDSCKGGDRI
jgi:hypothetical protein